MMSKEKRTYNSDVLAQFALHLGQTKSSLKNAKEQAYPIVPKKEHFSPELITRLTERIKNL